LFAFVIAHSEAATTPSCAANASSITLGLGNGIMQSVAPQVVAHVPAGCDGPLVATFSAWRSSRRLQVRVERIVFRRLPAKTDAVLAEWQWVNWCGGDIRVTLRAKVGDATASIPSVEAAPCNVHRSASTASALFICPGRPYAEVRKRPLAWCPPGFKPRP
jgi:hypothetical protein